MTPSTGTDPVSPATRQTASPTGRQRRVRLDQLIVERALASSRARAQAMLLAGQVLVGDGDAARRDRKPGDLVDPAVTIVLEQRDPYVSRGGHKLAAALDAFGIDPTGIAAMDVGASTGGFTDVLLQRGARRVYAVDVGRGQLADALRRDRRVVSMERTNARSLDATSLPEPVDLAVVDVSFISLAKVLGPIHREVLDGVVAAAAEVGLGTRAVIASPVLGPEGNREFLVHLAPGPGCAEIGERIAEAVGP
jgi:23S rRNA (cytidine1920-2'-O)/16S rRNA (cytidine1409-2'-O)-methyltransferase